MCDLPRHSPSSWDALRSHPAHVERAVAAARAALPRWRETSARRRTSVLRRPVALMNERRCDLAATMIFESSKPWREADGDVVEQPAGSGAAPASSSWRWAS